MKHFAIGLCALAAFGLFMAFMFEVVLKALPALIDAMSPTQSSTILIFAMIAPFSKWIGEGISAAMESRARFRP